MSSLSDIFLKTWYSARLTALSAILLPFALLYGLIVEIRASLYRWGFIRVERLAVPVVVVGNVTVGGTGKTPFVIELAKALQASGWKPGIISRGYGGKIGDNLSHALIVTSDSDPAEVGDEAVEIASRQSAPVSVGRIRAEAARHLLMLNPGTNVIISDDGLQHYALERQVEIGMLDDARRLGNGFPLPSGPLRERPSRLAQTTAIVLTATMDPLTQTTASDLAQFAPRVPVFRQTLAPVGFHQVARPELTREKTAFTGLNHIHAVAGIGNPDRFFASLRQLGITFTEHRFPDHYDFSADDLAFPGAEWVLMTEKDAVKCRSFADERCWFLSVQSLIPQPLLHLIEEKLHEPF